MASSLHLFDDPALIHKLIPAACSVLANHAL